MFNLFNTAIYYRLYYPRPLLNTKRDFCTLCSFLMQLPLAPDPRQVTGLYLGGLRFFKEILPAEYAALNEDTLAKIRTITPRCGSSIMPYRAEENYLEIHIPTAQHTFRELIAYLKQLDGLINKHFPAGYEKEIRINIPGEAGKQLYRKVLQAAFPATPKGIYNFQAQLTAANPDIIREKLNLPASFDDLPRKYRDVVVELLQHNAAHSLKVRLVDEQENVSAVTPVKQLELSLSLRSRNFDWFIASLTGYNAAGIFDSPEQEYLVNASCFGTFPHLY